MQIDQKKPGQRALNAAIRREMGRKPRPEAPPNPDGATSLNAATRLKAGR